MAYYQQVGRAGRGSANADVLLLPGSEDAEIWRYFATASMPAQDKAMAVLQTLGESPKAMSTPALEARVDLRRTPLELLLKVLAVDGAVRRVTGGWESTGQPWVYDEQRYRRIAAARVDEQQSMVEYERMSGCRMEYLAAALDDETASPCGRCDNCTGRWFAADVGQGAAERAGESLRHAGLPLDPRAMWPTGMDKLGVPVKGKLKANELLSTGRVLARLSDLGWGNALRAMFASGAPDAPMDPAMAQAVVAVLREWGQHGWEGAGRPVAVVSMPSRKKPLLLQSFAQAICEIGQLPYLGELSLQFGGPTGERGGNSAYRLAGVWDRFEVGPELASALADGPDGPVLLLDDLVDSRWSLTVAGRALRAAGAEQVLPLVLAQAG